MTPSRSGVLIRAVVSLTLTVLPSLSVEHPRAQAAPGPYALTDLGTLGGLSAQAVDLNEAGQVVGYATTAASGGHAFLWQDGVMSDLGSGSAAGINDNGQVVGVATIAPSTVGHAVLWQNGTVTDLTPGPDGSVAHGINEGGQIVGTLNYRIGFLWENGVLTELGHLGGGCSHAADIGDSGRVVGSSCTTHVTELGPMPHAFVWQDGVMTDLGVLPGDSESGASAINSLGQIVGSSGNTDPQTYEVTSRSFVYDGGTMTALPVPSWESYAGDINDAGQVVGTMRAAGGVGNYHAYIYSDGVVTNLNSLIPAGSGLHLVTAQAINNAGQIVGYAYDARMGYHAYLLTPMAAGTPVVNIGDASVTEGHAGTQSASLTVTLSVAASQPVTVSYGTANGSASAGSDYQSASGTVTFAAGETTKSIALLVNGDRTGEPNETVLVNLSQVAGNAVIGDGQGVVTIVDDEPRLTINDVSRNEGNSGTTQFVFTVSLSAASSVAVSVNFATSDGSARAVDDYAAKSGTLTFAPGDTSETVSVSVKGDRKYESSEVFGLNVSGASGAFVVDGQGMGLIRNDDRQ